MTLVPPPVAPPVEAPPVDAPPVEGDSPDIFDGWEKAWNESSAKWIFDQAGFVPWETVPDTVARTVSGQLALFEEGGQILLGAVSRLDDLADVASGWFDLILNGAIHALASVAGFATTDQISWLWSGMGRVTDLLNRRVQELRAYVDGNVSTLARLIGEANATAYVLAVNVLGAARAGDQFILRTIEQVDARVTNIVTDVTTIIEHDVTTIIEQLPAPELPDVQAMIDASLAPVLDRLDALEPLLALLPLVPIVHVLTGLPGVVERNADRADECCAANTGRLNRDEDLLDRLRPLLDLLALLGVTMGAHELLALIRGFMDDTAGGVESQLSDWLKS